MFNSKAFLGFFFFIAVVFVSCSDKEDDFIQADELIGEAKPEVGAMAPDFFLPDAGGNSHALANYKGKVVLLEFWASWCGICKGELPELKALYQEFENTDFEIIAVSVDTERDDWVNTVQEYDLPWLQLSDLKGPQSEAILDWKLIGVPQFVLIDQDGTILEIANRVEGLDAKIRKQLK